MSERDIEISLLSDSTLDPNALVQEVLHEAYLQTTEDLRLYAEKVRYFNQTKEVLRDYLSALRDSQIARWETQLNTVGDDAQLANVEMQNILQKQQQAIQMMSNISKLEHDNAMAIIRKIGG